MPNGRCAFTDRIDIGADAAAELAEPLSGSTQQRMSRPDNFGS